MELLKNIQLLPYNTFRISAKSEYFAKISEVNEILELQDNRTYSDLNKLVLGGGSNVLFTKDFNGLIMKNEIKGIELVEEDAQQVILKVGAGENWHDFVHCLLT